MQDWDLIKAYREAARSESDADQKRAERAFSELVHRHLNLVFSAALRSLDGNRSLAEDVAQKTFALLAAKAGQFSPSLSIVGWLYKTACNISRDALRAENRRRTRELEALQMHSQATDTSPDAIWDDMAPLLDQAMASLPENERVLILLRFFQRKPFCEVAAELQITEEAARMRASRALQKLRAYFSRRGVTLSSIAIGNALLASAVSAAPAALAASLAAPLKIATGSIPLSVTTKWVLMTTLQKSTIIAVALLLVIGIAAGSALQTVRKGQTRNIASSAITRASNTATPSIAHASINPSITAIADSRLDRAIANLRLALTSQWPDRRLPMARLRDAISDFGPHRKAAVPVLLEYLNGLRASRSLTAMAGVAYCLELLGTDASSALPDLLILLGSGDLAVWNDFIPRVFVALSPEGAIIPDLLNMISTPSNYSGEQLIYTLEKLFALNPAAADTHRERIQSLMNGGASRFTAAVLLARMPGAKDPAVVPILTNALHLTRFQMVIGQDFIDDQGLHLVYATHESVQDDLARLSALQALGAMGSAASNALPALLAFAGHVTTNSPFNLRDLALVAIGKIDPTYKSESPDVALALFQHERTAEILQKAESGTASLAELTEGLHLENAANHAARALENHPEARAAIPALVEAVNHFGSDEAVDRLKELDPHLLIDRVRAGDDRAIAEVARALGELGPNAAAALPHLHAMLDATSPDHPEAHRVYALDEAIHKIDPRQPKLVYNFEDLDRATTLLTTAIYAQNKIDSPVYDAYTRLFQDRNAVSRGHLFRFVEATKADPDLHRIFTDQLLRDHPDLAADLTAASAHSR